jgi:hypothetical protein
MPNTGQDMELDEVLLKRLFKQKEKIISLLKSINNSELKKWAQAWEGEDKLQPATSFMDVATNVEAAHDPQKLAELVAAAIVMPQFMVAYDSFMAGDFDKALDGAFETEFGIGFYTGSNHQTFLTKKQQGQIRHFKTRAIKRLVIEHYIKNLQNRSDTNAADAILDHKIIEKDGKGWEAPAHKTLVSYISFIKQLLAISQKLAPWEDVKKINADAPTRALTKEEFSRYTIRYPNGDIQNYFQCIEANLVLLFLDSNLENAAARNTSLEKAKSRLIALGEMFVRQIKNPYERKQKNTVS